MFSVCVCFSVCVQVEALRRADHPSKESYRLSLIKKLSPMLRSGSNEEEKKRYLIMNNFYLLIKHNTPKLRLTKTVRMGGRAVLAQ
jgi:hypothetical protein